MSTGSIYIYGSGNNKIHLHTWLYYKDILSLVSGPTPITVQILYGIITLVHGDNTIEYSAVVTPIHILPE
jgi:hypothetical protein